VADITPGEGIRPVGGTPAAPRVRRGERRRDRDRLPPQDRERSGGSPADDSGGRKGRNIDERC
jgi:hypothetical protein